MTASAASTARQDLEAFLFREARLADENRYDEWFALWTEDVRYWVPVNIDDYDPDEHVSIIYDDRERLELRISRLKSGGAWAQEPQSRMRRLISNIEIEPAGRERMLGHLELRAWANCAAGAKARTSDSKSTSLAYDARGLRMAAKTVVLVKNNEPLHNLSFLI